MDISHSYNSILVSNQIIMLITCSWEGKGDKEIGKDAATGQVLVRVDPRYYRPTEVELLVRIQTFSTDFDHD